MLDRHLKYILRSLTVWWAGALFPSSYIYIDQTVKLYVITAQISHLNRQCCFWKKCHQKFTNCIFIGLISLATPSSHRVGYSLQQSTSFKWQNNFQLQSKGSIQGRDFNINLGPVNNFTCVANGAIPSDDKYYSCYNGNKTGSSISPITAAIILRSLTVAIEQDPKDVCKAILNFPCLKN